MDDGEIQKLMSGLICVFFIVAVIIVLGAKQNAKKNQYVATAVEKLPMRKRGIYEKYIKRILDILCALAALICFSPLYIVVAILVKVKLGSPVLFTQDRPGMVNEEGKETIFKMYKFRTMTDERDENGELLSDEIRLTSFGKWLRSTSLDELPEALNILNGTLSVVGPRPQLVRDMTFMTKEQRMRHTAKPGLSGLAQVNGRNNITWEQKFEYDLQYINAGVSFWGDIKIIFKTIGNVLQKKDVVREGTVSDMDFGDWLLQNGKVAKDDYEQRQINAKKILGV